MNTIESTFSFQPTFRLGNYSHKVPVGYTLREATARGLDWVVIKKNGKDIVSISERPVPIRSCRYRIYLHSYPNRKIQLEDNMKLFELFLSAHSNNILSKRDVTQYIFGTDDIAYYSKLIDLFIEE